MRNILRSLVLAPVVMTAVALASNSALAATTMVNVPFSFQAAGKVCPAGQYSVDRDTNHNFVILQNRQTAQTFRWVLGPGDAATKDSIVKLHFDKHELGYSLESVEIGSQTTPHFKTGKHSEHQPVEIAPGQ